MKIVLQSDSVDCGPACLSMVFSHYGIYADLDNIKELSGLSVLGASLYSLAEIAEMFGFKTNCAILNFNELKEEAILPAIVYWKQNHFLVIESVSNKAVTVLDPAYGKLTYSRKEFSKGWFSQNDKQEGIVLLMVRQKEKSKVGVKPVVSSFHFLTISKFISKHKKPFFFAFFTLFIGLAFQIAIPIITKNAIDISTKSWDLSLISVLVIAQISLLIGRLITSYTSGIQLLYLSTAINLEVLFTFFTRLFRLPVSFIENRKSSDVLMRVSDNSRIEYFFTKVLLSGGFAIITFFFFIILLARYNLIVLSIFLVFATVYLVFTNRYSKKISRQDFLSFDVLRENQSHILQSINGFKDIKLFLYESRMIEIWKGIQQRLFTMNFTRLHFQQMQGNGSVFIVEVQNILILFVCLYEYFQNRMTLGLLFSLQYITGQLNVPLLQFSEFINGIRVAKIGFERLDEIYKQKTENEIDQEGIQRIPHSNFNSIRFSGVSFKYNGSENYVLRDLNFEIPQGKITAIVGQSGSGKTTLLKLILKYYSASKGLIYLGDFNYGEIDTKAIRLKMSAVTQDGFLFEDTIRNNIVMGGEYSPIHISNVLGVCNMSEFISTLPLRDETLIGSELGGLSSGQKQRILLARCIYKNSEIYILDEATNCLDSLNERQILDRFRELLEGKTVLIVAHRMSTVRNADNIIVLSDGCLVEQGMHKELVELRGKYFELIKNQLELDGE